MRTALWAIAAGVWVAHVHEHGAMWCPSWWMMLLIVVGLFCSLLIDTLRALELLEPPVEPQRRPLDRMTEGYRGDPHI